MADTGFWVKSNKLMILGIVVVVLGVLAMFVKVGFNGSCTEGEPCKVTFRNGDSVTVAWAFADVSETTVVSGTVPTVAVPAAIVSQTVSATER